MMRPILVPVFLALLTFSASAAEPVDEPLPGPVQGHVLRVVDGDTVRVRARIWLGQEVETNVRLRGVDTPETRGKCDWEREASAKATQFVIKLVAEGDSISLTDISYDKYGKRVVANIRTAQGHDLTQALLQSGLGRAYEGGHKQSWCKQTDDN